MLCDGKTLVDIPMEPQQAEGVRAALERNGVECTLEARDATFGGSKMAERWKFIHKKNDALLNSEAERWRKAMEEGLSLIHICIVAKNRHGETSTVPLGWDGAHTRFMDVDFKR